ncbi:MAG: RagB/SusD family nutrient uptake outer membrane protein [Bacteroidetes bacterium]|nr:MAG: RagB/SusD family nutrient uptake outer membrane protein [Bacteroidota bacterium]
MKKLLYITAIFAFLWVSCDILDVNPQHSIPADAAINNRNDVIRAVNGCYDAFQAAGYYGRNYIAVGDLSADNLIWSGTTAGYNQIDNNSILSDNVVVEGIWASIYSALNRVNNVLDRVPEINDSNFSQQERDEIMSEMYFLRALAHYDLMRLFGGVPLRTRAARPTEEDLNISRSSMEDVFAQIFEDLESAAAHIPGTIVRGKASEAAVHALKARVSLHFYYFNPAQNSAFLETARNAATKAINEFNLSLESDFAYLFSGNNNTESIFEIEFNEQDRNRLAEYFLPTAISGRYEFAPDSTLVENYEPADTRLDASIAFASGAPYAIKYSDIETGTDNVYVLRLAEMYLVRAEANALLNEDASIILDDLNAVRERAELAPSTTTNPETLLLEIEEQRRLEFAFEGHRWFDLVRTGRAVDVLEGITNTNQTLFPIPLNEILANDAIGEEDQNPGY